MSVRTSIILVVALVMVAGWVLFVELGKTPEAEEEPPWFYNVDINDMTRISITDGEDQANFYLDVGDRWRMDSPDGLPVGLDRWGGITLLLSGPKTRRLLDAEPTNLDQYGLESLATSVVIDLRDGRTITILMGFPTPDDVGFYGQIEGFPHLYTIEGGWKTVLTRLVHEPPFPEWYYAINTALLQDIEVETPDGMVELSINEDREGWHLDDEEMTPVDQELIDELLEALEQPTQSHGAYGPVNLEEYGLAEPSLTLLLRTTETRPDGVRFISTTIFRFGDATEDGSGYYGQAQREEIIHDLFVVEADWYDRLKDVADRLPLTETADQGS